MIIFQSLSKQTDEKTLRQLRKANWLTFMKLRIPTNQILEDRNPSQNFYLALDHKQFAIHLINAHPVSPQNAEKSSENGKMIKCLNWRQKSKSTKLSHARTKRRRKMEKKLHKQKTTKSKKPPKTKKKQTRNLKTCLQTKQPIIRTW